ncbi:hypothetical protein BJI67_15900 (plasmid) [Acidihalobacter aeolianus]|uniref:ERF family protein n=1 Tax=Acidihalobacter aeolianus TaxID=2792603 RepID=A0A1D8KCP3_9GAMM|nr:ERF family protein [Acidihalobacter aeolianus]AOV18726.1 hypothetical protein BJI67_15900 [Acidihalobacter aeolianus]
MTTNAVKPATVSSIKQSEVIQHAGLHEALSAAQYELIGLVLRDGTNENVGKAYPTLDRILSVLIPVFYRHGLLLMQPPSHQEGRLTIKTTIVHVASGESVIEPFEIMVPSGASITVIGALITYMRRYSLSPLVGLSAVADDDGQSIGALSVNNADTPHATTVSLQGRQEATANRSDLKVSQRPTQGQPAESQQSTPDRIRAHLKSTGLDQLPDAVAFINGRPDLSQDEKDELLGLCSKRKEELEALEANQDAGQSS